MCESERSAFFFQGKTVCNLFLLVTQYGHCAPGFAQSQIMAPCSADISLLHNYYLMIASRTFWDTKGEGDFCNMTALPITLWNSNLFVIFPFMAVPVCPFP